MGMSTHAVGFRAPDEKWNQMLAIWNSCETAGVPIPREVSTFFEGEDPNGKPGMEVDLKGAAKEWSDQYRGGYEIHVSLLPPDVKIIRVYNSW